MARDDESEKRVRGDEFVLPHDPVGEQVLLAACAADWDGDGARLLERLQPDALVDERHRAIWAGLREMRARRLAFDFATLQRVVGDKAHAHYLAELASLRPDSPADLEFHMGNVQWDRQRVNLATGALPALLEALRKQEPRERVQALARGVAESVAGSGQGQWFHDKHEIVREQMLEIRRRVAGHACHPYGIRGLDVDLDTKRRRMLPGAAPKQITVVTGVSGSGKTTVTGHLVLGLARQGKRVLYGAWEMNGGMTIELLTCLSLGWSRSRLTEGAEETGEFNEEGDPVLRPLFAEEELLEFEGRMEQIRERVTFMKNPFRRGRGREARKGGKDWDANERNLDVVQEHIADSGCDVFVGDLWRRCLRDTSPEAEEEGLMRQQAMTEDQGIHAILLQQQRLKDIESRADKRPTREGIKGSGAWTEVADTILATHRPAQWKKMDDDFLELFVLKQRYGKWPLGVELEWDADRGSLKGGRTIDYEATAMEGTDVFTESQARMPGKGRRKKFQ